jgi:hypothetical protein
MSSTTAAPDSSRASTRPQATRSAAADHPSSAALALAWAVREPPAGSGTAGVEPRCAARRGLHALYPGPHAERISSRSPARCLEPPQAVPMPSAFARALLPRMPSSSARSAHLAVARPRPREQCAELGHCERTGASKGDTQQGVMAHATRVWAGRWAGVRVGLLGTLPAELDDVEEADRVAGGRCHGRPSKSTSERFLTTSIAPCRRPYDGSSAVAASALIPEITGAPVWPENMMSARTLSASLIASWMQAPAGSSRLALLSPLEPAAGPNECGSG